MLRACNRLRGFPFLKGAVQAVDDQTARVVHAVDRDKGGGPVALAGGGQRFAAGFVGGAVRLVLRLSVEKATGYAA